VFLRDLGYNTGQFGKNHLGDHPEALPRPETDLDPQTLQAH
jgi:arylsulfatase A-like enzyme